MSLTEQRLMEIVECIAAGLTVNETRGTVANGHDLPLDSLIEARDEALAQGIEAEDIAPSWRSL